MKIKLLTLLCTFVVLGSSVAFAQHHNHHRKHKVWVPAHYSHKLHHRVPGHFVWKY